MGYFLTYKSNKKITRLRATILKNNTWSTSPGILEMLGLKEGYELLLLNENK